MKDISEIPDQDRICRAFAYAASQTWEDLRDSADIEETSITDYRLLNLKRMCPQEIQVIKFSRFKESRIGADWEWWFGANDEWFGMRVQAKKLNSYLEYAHLGHIVESKKTGLKARQIDTLIQKATEHDLYPMYCFYNHWSDSKDSPMWPCQTYNPTPVLWGMSVADAEITRQLLDNKEQNLQVIGRYSMLLTCLVCCRGFVGNKEATLPERARAVALALSQGVGSVPPIVTNLPSHVEISRHGEVPANIPDLDGILIVNEGPRNYTSVEDTSSSHDR